jgi:hypothetical protein
MSNTSDTAAVFVIRQPWRGSNSYTTEKPMSGALDDAPGGVVGVVVDEDEFDVSRG